MLDFSTRQIITHLLHVNKSKFNSGIGYYMIIGHDLVVKLGLISYFIFSVFGWDDTSVHIKYLGNLLGNHTITKPDMHEVAIQNKETVSNIKDT